MFGVIVRENGRRSDYEEKVGRNLSIHKFITHDAEEVCKKAKATTGLLHHPQSLRGYLKL